MWELIKYCFYCMGTTISASFGYNPERLTWKTGITGVLTTIVLLSILATVIWLINKIKYMR